MAIDVDHGLREHTDADRQAERRGAEMAFFRCDPGT